MGKKIIGSSLEIKNIYLLIFTIILWQHSILIGLCSQLPHNHIHLPIYPEARAISKYVNDDESIYSVSYKINVDYPAKEVIKFYHLKLHSLGFLPQEKDAQSKNWEVFRENTKDVRNIVKRYAETWVSKDKTKQVIFLLLYDLSSPCESLRDLKVTIQISPYFDDKDIEVFYKELEENGEYTNFMKLLEKYATADGKIDFSKAKKENPNNEYIERYEMLLKKIYGEKAIQSVQEP